MDFPYSNQPLGIPMDPPWPGGAYDDSLRQLLIRRRTQDDFFLGDLALLVDEWIGFYPIIIVRIVMIIIISNNNIVFIIIMIIIIIIVYCDDDYYYYCYYY